MGCRLRIAASWLFNEAFFLFRAERNGFRPENLEFGNSLVQVQVLQRFPVEIGSPRGVSLAILIKIEESSTNAA